MLINLTPDGNWRYIADILQLTLHISLPIILHRKVFQQVFHTIIKVKILQSEQFSCVEVFVNVAWHAASTKLKTCKYWSWTFCSKKDACHGVSAKYDKHKINFPALSSQN